MTNGKAEQEFQDFVERGILHERIRRLEKVIEEERSKKTIVTTTGVAVTTGPKQAGAGQNEPARFGAHGRAAAPVGSPSKVDKKAAQRALMKQIQDRVWAEYEAGKKKQYDLAQPETEAVAWLIFDRATGELLAEETAQQGYRAWQQSCVRSHLSGCRLVKRSDWEAAEERVRNKKGKENGA